MIYNLKIRYQLYFFLNRLRGWYLKDGKLRYIVSQIAYKFYMNFNFYLENDLPKYYKNNPITINVRRQKRLIASLTSFPGRIDKVWMAIESIFHQSVKPDKIILWLAKSQFPNEMRDIPLSLVELCDRGLEIYFVEDYKSHKKYYYSMKEFPDDIIVLFDDDIIYPPDTIRKLMKYHHKYPNAVIGTSTYKPHPFLNSLPSVWVADNRKIAMKPTVTNQVFSGAGSLWPPNCLDQRVFEIEKAMQLVPYADDLWLYTMMLLNGTKACRCRRYVDFPHEVLGTQVETLYRINTSIGLNQNDVQWEKLISEYNIELRELYFAYFSENKR